MSSQEQTDLIKRLDPIEKSLVDDSKMPIEKVKLLLDAQVSLEDYFYYPWLSKGISEIAWIRQQQAGISGDDTIISTRQVASKEWAVVQNFFVPGLHQFKRAQLLKGFLMSGIALSSLSLYFIHKAPDSNRSIGCDYPVYLFILGGDLLWSSIDIDIQINRELNKDAMRFSYLITVPFKVPL
jgi:hypothetical protein